jgi:hypothetical protein
MKKRQVSQRQRDQLAKRRAMGPALIERPLRFIRSTVGAKHWEYLEAKEYAREGNGAAVRHIARHVLRPD